MSIVVIVLAAVIGGLVVGVGRAIIADGYGTRPAPRSHHEEVGSWVAQQLQR